MPRNEFKFQPALPHPIKWSVGENQYNEDGKFPRSLTLTIPVDSIIDLANHLMALRDDESKIKSDNVWDYENNEEKEVDVIKLYAKGKEGRYGDFGNINPQKTEAQLQAQDGRRSSSEEIPF